jgi:hypothetical protein
MPRMLLSLLAAGFKLGHIARRDFGAREVRLHVCFLDSYLATAHYMLHIYCVHAPAAIARMPLLHFLGVVTTCMLCSIDAW